MRLSFAILFTSLIDNATSSSNSRSRSRNLISRSKQHENAITTKSAAGKKLLSKARRLEDNGDVDYSWMTDYSFQFQKCYSWDAYGREENERKQSFVLFKACPLGSCSSTCKYGADYIVEMRDFVESYMEAKKNLRQYNCEQVEDNCNCDDDDAVDDNDACMENCYEEAGLSYCGEENDFEVQDYAECGELDMYQDDDGSAYYASLYCTDDGASVKLGVFTDEECTVLDSSNAYYKSYGANLPYSSKSILGSSCISCSNPFYVANDDDANENQDQEEVNEMCMELYDMAGKCESELEIDYPTTDACDYIHNVVPSLEKLFNGENISGSSGLTWFFAITSLALLGVVFYLVKSTKSNTSINLSDQGGILT